MPDCEKLAKCPFFNDRMKRKPASSEMYKNSYCRGDYINCARYKVVQSGLEVPLDLFPNQVERAEKIISGK